VGAGLVAVRVRVDAGALHDMTGTGLAALLAERLARSAPGEPRGAPPITLTLHEEPTAAANVRWIELAGTALPGELPALMAALARRLAHVTEPVALAEWKALLDSASERAREHAASPETAAWMRALAELHAPGSPRALPAWSTEAALSHASPAALVAFARAHVRPERLHLAVAGAVSAAEARAVLEAAVGRWQAPARLHAGRSKAAPPAARGGTAWREVLVSDDGSAQNDLLVAWPGERRTTADRAATRALLYLLGETGYAGRLGRVLVGPGLVYSVRASLEDDGGAGLLAIRTAAGRAHTRAVLDHIRTTLQEAARGGFTQAELEEAKAYLRGRDTLRRQGARDAAEAALEDATQAPVQDPQTLTLAQLNAAARALLARGAPVAVVSGPGLE
jgi:zinc protease